MSSAPGPSSTRRPWSLAAPAESDDRWNLVLRVTGSHTFTKAAQLRDILLYLSRHTLDDPGAAIREYEIGCNVLGRKSDFNPQVDNIVRVQVSHLRKKLAEYFAAEGKDEPVEITIPKGSYVPRFAARADAVAPLETPSPRAYRPILAAAALLLLGIGIGALAALAVHPAPAKAAPDPILAEAWGPFASPYANVLVSTATPLNLEFAPESYRAYGTPTYPAPKEAYAWFSQHRPLIPGGKLGMFFTDNMLGVGTMDAVVTTSSVLRSFGASYQLLPERVATLPTLRGRNAILFGAPIDSEVITQTLERTPLTVDWDAAVRDLVIRDRVSGQTLPPLKDSEGKFLGVYGLITVLNTRDSDRGRLGMIVFSGISSGGTQGAAEFFSSPRSLHKLRDIFSRSGVNGFPAAYQVVVKCTFSNLLVQSEEYYSHRILEPR